MASDFHLVVFWSLQCVVKNA